MAFLILSVAFPAISFAGADAFAQRRKRVVLGVGRPAGGLEAGAAAERPGERKEKRGAGDREDGKRNSGEAPQRPPAAQALQRLAERLRGTVAPFGRVGHRDLVRKKV